MLSAYVNHLFRPILNLIVLDFFIDFLKKTGMLLSVIEII
jgi:hypothetical protein